MKLARLDELLARGVANGLEGLRLLSREEMLEIEPTFSACGPCTCPRPESQITRRSTAKYAEIATAHGAEVRVERGGGGF